MITRIQKFRRVWGFSPLMALTFLFRNARKHAKRFLPQDEWNKNWLGEEMRPFNSLRSN